MGVKSETYTIYCWDHILSAKIIYIEVLQTNTFENIQKQLPFRNLLALMKTIFIFQLGYAMSNLISLWFAQSSINHNE